MSVFRSAIRPQLACAALLLSIGIACAEEARVVLDRNEIPRNGAASGSVQFKLDEDARTSVGIREMLEGLRLFVRYPRETEWIRVEGLHMIEYAAPGAYPVLKKDVWYAFPVYILKTSDAFVFSESGTYGLRIEVVLRDNTVCADTILTVAAVESENDNEKRFLQFIKERHKYASYVDAFRGGVRGDEEISAAAISTESVYHRELLIMGAYQYCADFIFEVYRMPLESIRESTMLFGNPGRTRAYINKALSYAQQAGLDESVWQIALEKFGEAEAGKARFDCSGYERSGVRWRLR